VRKIRYAVVGLGHISQAALLPGLKNAKNGALAALVSDDDKKLRDLSKRYRLEPEATYSYDEYPSSPAVLARQKRPSIRWSERAGGCGLLQPTITVCRWLMSW
jgi:hypothetical protein